jgi:hypothetical protein
MLEKRSFFPSLNFSRLASPVVTFSSSSAGSDSAVVNTVGINFNRDGAHYIFPRGRTSGRGSLSSRCRLLRETASSRFYPNLTFSKTCQLRSGMWTGYVPLLNKNLDCMVGDSISRYIIEMWNFGGSEKTKSSSLSTLPWIILEIGPFA